MPTRCFSFFFKVFVSKEGKWRWSIMTVLVCPERNPGASWPHSSWYCLGTVEH